jgi:ferredoxin
VQIRTAGFFEGGAILKIVIDWDRCEGNGACVPVAPALFEIDDQDMLIVLNETPPEDQRKALERAVAACPRRAISIEG